MKKPNPGRAYMLASLARMNRLILARMAVRKNRAPRIGPDMSALETLKAVARHGVQITLSGGRSRTRGASRAAGRDARRDQEAQSRDRHVPAGGHAADGVFRCRMARRLRRRRAPQLWASHLRAGEASAAGATTGCSISMYAPSSTESTGSCSSRRCANIRIAHGCCYTSSVG